MDNIPIKNKKKSGKPKSKIPKTDGITFCDKNQMLFSVKGLQALMIQSVRVIQKKC